MRFLPHVTVATIVEDKGRFLMVEEIKNNRKVLNQPAGHLERNETLLAAALRETLEETAWDVELTGVIGVYLFTGDNGISYQRICFAANPLKHYPDQPLDDGIVGTVWLTRDELMAQRDHWRNPMILNCIDDYLAGHIYPLSVIRV
ncbi:NUDIX hydrolase [Entomomonas asaccharolytica]|uniref:Phosphatase NudJ n=1 Tax=Entomomonas asaccharolytica TaxID=2785331 RepID=A0A974RXK2_9GAMM|nr:NUDIX hydrolase [Entomomonas asaccharolytica]QQP84949.1 NUDIX hydrolase [Entomomonas asaccharolytica]